MTGSNPEVGAEPVFFMRDKPIALAAGLKVFYRTFESAAFQLIRTNRPLVHDKT